MMSVRLLLLVVSISVCLGVCRGEQKPAWVGNTPKELNVTYKFVEVVTSASSLEAARRDALNMLTENEQLQNGVRVYRKTEDVTDIERQWNGTNPMEEHINQRTHINLTLDGVSYDLQANKIDEYAESENGIIRLHTLFQVATCENPAFDNVYITDKYGVLPVALSLIPGAGQMYKGSWLKGSCILGAEVISVVAIILCENQRADYARKMIEQPRFAKEYNTKAGNWETGRNICIGAAAAVYVYNLLDAALSKGARKVVFSRSNNWNLSLRPAVLSQDYGVGMSFICNF